MLIKKPGDIKSSEITDKKIYLSRRTFIRGLALAATTTATGLLYRSITGTRAPGRRGNQIDYVQAPPEIAQLNNEALTSYDDITHYNNYYEFSTNKQAVAGEASNFITRPWTVEVGGLVHKPAVFDIDEILKFNPLEERVYRLRCVERWSMVIPWVGFSLAKLLDQVQPMSNASYVSFQSLADPAQMPNISTDILDWPYVEGLRLDEAMHPLTILAVGLYGETLPPQNGAPLRLVVPWKYGFKGIKSIVKINLVEQQPPTTWNIANAPAYGFYSNVNPVIGYPWSQAKENRIGEYGIRDTLLFNGYADQVAHLYDGMDLRVYY